MLKVLNMVEDVVPMSIFVGTRTMNMQSYHLRPKENYGHGRELIKEKMQRNPLGMHISKIRVLENLTSVKVHNHKEIKENSNVKSHLYRKKWMNSPSFLRLLPH